MTSAISLLARSGSRTQFARACALVSGIAGLVAGLLLIGFFALASPHDSTPGGPTWMGTANDVVGIVQLAAFAPVIWALRRRLPPTRWLRAITVVAVAATIAFAVLGVLLVTNVLTFEQQIGPLIVTILLIYAWLLTANLAAHRFRTLPRAVTPERRDAGCRLPYGHGACRRQPGSCQPCWSDDRMGRLRSRLPWLLGLPVYSLLLAARVFIDWEVRHPAARSRTH